VLHQLAARPTTGRLTKGSNGSTIQVTRSWQSSTPDPVVRTTDLHGCAFMPRQRARQGASSRAGDSFAWIGAMSQFWRAAGAPIRSTWGQLHLLYDRAGLRPA